MKPLFSIAYFPPVKYLSLLSGFEEILIEAEENFQKQTFRNRMVILSANGPLALSVPVLEGSFHKRKIKDIRIDYTKRWQQVHTRSIVAAYTAAPFYQYYSDEILDLINSKSVYLLDLCLKSLELVNKLCHIKASVSITEEFFAPSDDLNDMRYRISPKSKNNQDFIRDHKAYRQVFSDRFGFAPGLTVLDLLFNEGPDSKSFL